MNDLINSISLTGQAKLFGSAASGRLENITDIDALEYVPLENAADAQKWTKKLKEIIEKKRKDLVFVNLEAGMDPDYYYPPSTSFNQIKKVDTGEYLDWIRQTGISKGDLRKIEGILKEDSGACGIIRANQIIKKYRNLVWKKKDIQLGYLKQNGKKFKLMNTLQDKNTNIKINYLLLDQDKNGRRDFYQVELSYLFYYQDGKNGDKKVLYNQTNNDLIYDIYKFYCQGKYLKTLKRLRSLLTKLYFGIGNNSNKPWNALEKILDKYGNLAVSRRNQIGQYRKNIYANVHQKFNMDSARLARIDALLEVMNNKLYSDFGMTSGEFQALVGQRNLEEEKKELSEKLNQEARLLLPRYMDFLKNQLQLQLNN